jgi:23S rRNA (guanosine2251-2'-O)-methyltransferase
MTVRKWRMDELEARSALNLKGLQRFPLTVICDNIRSAHNVGSIFRSADALGIGQIVLCGITAQPPHREIFKTALGATESVQWSYEPDICAVASLYKEKGFILVGVEQTTDSVAVHTFQWPLGPVAIIVGNEVDGLSEDVLPLMDYFVEIPQAGTKHSLNVSVAAGIIMWEILRNRI